MTDIAATIEHSEKKIDEVLWSQEVAGQIHEALVEYRAAEVTLKALNIGPIHPAYAEQQRVLAYCLMRQGNVLRQLGQSREALALSEREHTAARASGDAVTLGRSLMSSSTNYIVAGEVERGLGLLAEARTLFESGASYDHTQGLGWWWILRADLLNAGLISGGPDAVIESADRALEILAPLENWPGVARAYSARALAHDNLGDDDATATDRTAQQRCERLMQSKAGGGT